MDKIQSANSVTYLLKKYSLTITKIITPKPTTIPRNAKKPTTKPVTKAIPNKPIVNSAKDNKISVKIVFAENFKVKEVKSLLLQNEPIILFLK